MGHAWILIVGAITAEIAAALLLRASDGFKKTGTAVLALCAFAGAFYLIGLALVTLPVSSVYPVWAGGGTAGVATVGIVLLGERAHLIKVLGVLLVIAGIVLINVATGKHMVAV